MRIALIIAVMTLVTLLSPVAEANTYPPENAVVIYYKIISEYPPDGDEDIMNKIEGYAKDEIELDEDIVKHLDKYQYIIKDLTVASDIAYCNWGIDFSEGLETRLPYLGTFKRYTYLLISDARRLILKGDFYEAIDRCVTAEKFAWQVSGDTLISSLVGSAICRMSDKCIIHILSETPVDIDKLLHLRGQLGHFNNRIKRMKDGFLAEKKLAEVLYDKKSPHRITLETLEECEYVESELKLKSENSDLNIKKELIEKVKSEDAQFFDEVLKYHVGIVYDIAVAFDRSYMEAYEIVSRRIPDSIEKDSKEKPEALLTNIFMPACGKLYGHAIRGQNSLNAIKAALEVYIALAETGKMPRALPANTPRDLFSGKEFVYEVTSEGFILRCQGKDLGDDTIHEYEFKVRK